MEKETTTYKPDVFIYASHRVGVKLLGPNAKMPTRATGSAAGYDLYAAEKFTLMPGKRKLISTELTLEIPSGYEGQIRPRSGLALKSGVTVLNAPGTIDADYRGTVGVVLINHGEDPFTVNIGDRIAQLVVAKLSDLPLETVQDVSSTDRAAGGFGSTGK